MPAPGPRTTYRYSDVFKATAVRLSQLPGVSVSDVAESLYILPFMLLFFLASLPLVVLYWVDLGRKIRCVSVRSAPMRFLGSRARIRPLPARFYVTLANSP